MAKFRKLPVEIEAMQVPPMGWMDPTFGALTKWLNGDWQKRTLTVCDEGVVINTLEGDHLAKPGDWIIRGVHNEIYPCKPDIFAATYEPVEQ